MKAPAEETVAALLTGSVYIYPAQSLFRSSVDFIGLIS